MSCPDKTPEIPKFRRMTGSATRLSRLHGPTRPLRILEDVQAPCSSNITSRPSGQSNSIPVQNGHSQPLQPHRLRRRLPPERLSEIGELLKTIDLGEERSRETRTQDEQIAEERKPMSQKSSPEPVFAKPTAPPVPRTPAVNVDNGSKSTIQSFAPMSKIITINNKEYMVIGDLGSGGSCKVYSALHEGQIVAIKVVTLPNDSAVKENYLREIHMLKKLSDCEQVVKLMDHEEVDNKIFMVMEKGDSDLCKVLQKASRDWITVRFFWRDMLRAVERIHKLGIIHQDLKPANFIIVKGRLKLIDFGISDDIGDATSVFRDCAIGTFNYMSPEIIQQSQETWIKTSRASDIWSLGCILYSLAFGDPPFAHIKNVNSKVLAIVDPKHQIHYPPEADPDLVDVLKKCLVRQPKERPSAEQLLQHNFVQGPPSVRSTYLNN